MSTEGEGGGVAPRPPEGQAGTQDYASRTAVLTTKHGKLDQIGPALQRTLGLAVVDVSLDTDQLGTFSGELPRTLSDLDCAVTKARLGMAERHSDLGLASEGTFGPHPDVPWLTTDHELVVLVDDRVGHVFWERVTSTDITAVSETVDAGTDLATLADRAGLPDHAVIVRPLPPPTSGNDFAVHKGIQSLADLESAVASVCSRSDIGKALVMTDFRAHLCPSRQAVITQAAERLGARVATCCPRCDAHGFGRVDLRRGVPCAWCGLLLAIVRAEVDGCWQCGFEIERPVGAERADPGMCSRCNP